MEPKSRSTYRRRAMVTILMWMATMALIGMSFIWPSSHGTFWAEQFAYPITPIRVWLEYDPRRVVSCFLVLLLATLLLIRFQFLQFMRIRDFGVSSDSIPSPYLETALQCLTLFLFFFVAIVAPYEREFYIGVYPFLLFFLMPNPYLLGVVATMTLGVDLWALRRSERPLVLMPIILAFTLFLAILLLTHMKESIYWEWIKWLRPPRTGGS